MFQSEDLQGVDSGSLLTDGVAMRRLVDQVEGEWLRRVGEVHARGAARVVGAGSTKAFLGGTCLVFPSEASRAVATASALRSTCQATAEAIAAGMIGVGQAQVIAKVITDLSSPESLAIMCPAIEPLSAPNPGADRVERPTPARRRLHAMVEIMRHHLNCQQAPDVRRPGAHLTVVTGAGTLAGEPGGSALDWGGVISGETSRRRPHHSDEPGAAVPVPPPTGPARRPAPRPVDGADQRTHRPTRLRPTPVDRPTRSAPATAVATRRVKAQQRGNVASDVTRRCPDQPSADPAVPPVVSRSVKSWAVNRSSGHQRVTLQMVANPSATRRHTASRTAASGSATSSW